MSSRTEQGSSDHKPDTGAPPTEAGAPPVQQQEQTSLESPDISGRPPGEGEDTIERTGAQTPGRKDPEAVQPPGRQDEDRNTM